MKCMREDCGHTATWQMGMRLWAPGDPKRDDNCATGLSSIVVCDGCRDGVTPEDMLTDSNKEIMANTFLQSGRRAPDFSGVEIFFEPIIDGEPEDVSKPPGALR